jgi:hypothetical protein
MMTLSKGLDLIDGLLTRTLKNINTKPEYYRPIYHLYYMIIYVAIQDSFDYPKAAGKLKRINRANQKYRNKKQSVGRVEARQWLLESDDCKKIWDIISDTDYSLLNACLQNAYSSFQEECKSDSRFNGYHNKSREVSSRLRGLAL